MRSVTSIISDSLQPYGLLCPWDSPGENTGVGCHAPPPGDLPNPGIEPAFLVASALQVGFLPTEPRGKPTAWKYR